MAVVINGTTGINSPGETVTGPFVISGSGQDQFRFTDGTQNLYMDADTNGVAIAGGPGQTLGGIYLYNSQNKVALFTNNALRVIVDSSGRVTMPYQPSFLVEGTSYTQTSGGASKIIPSSEVFDIGSNYDLANGRFTAPVSGVYLFGFFGLSYPQGATEVSSLQYQKNGSAYGDNMQFGGGSSSHQGVAGGITVNMSANDYVELFYTSAAGSTSKAYGSQWNMYGHLIG